MFIIVSFVSAEAHPWLAFVIPKPMGIASVIFDFLSIKLQVEV